MKNKNIFTKKDTQFITKNYPSFGTKYCSDKIGLTMIQTLNKAKKLKLSLNKNGWAITEKLRKNKIYQNRISKFKPKFNEHQSYALGLLWADGYLYQNKKFNAKSLRLEVVEKDYWDFHKCLQSLGNIKTYKRSRKNRQTSISAYIKNYGLSEWLSTVNFFNKSKASPVELINFIQKKFKKDFFRGWSDGDGCFYINLKNKCFQYSLAGSYNQNWSVFTNFLKENNIQYKISKRIQNQNSKSSTIKITGLKNLKKLIKIFYDDPKDLLKRKYKKALIIQNYKTE